MMLSWSPSLQKLRTYQNEIKHKCYLWNRANFVDMRIAFLHIMTLHEGYLYMQLPQTILCKFEYNIQSQIKNCCYYYWYNCSSQ